MDAGSVQAVKLQHQNTVFLNHEQCSPFHFTSATFLHHGCGSDLILKCMYRVSLETKTKTYRSMLAVMSVTVWFLFVAVNKVARYGNWLKSKAGHHRRGRLVS